MRSAFHVYVPRSRRTTTNSSRSRITCQCSGPMPCSPQSQTSGLCGKFGNRLFTAMVVRARRKNAGIAGPTSNPCFGQQVNAAMATVASSRFTELYKRPTRSLPTRLGRLYPVAAHDCSSSRNNQDRHFKIIATVSCLRMPVYPTFSRSTRLFLVGTDSA